MKKQNKTKNLELIDQLSQIGLLSHAYMHAHIYVHTKHSPEFKQCTDF